MEGTATCANPHTIFGEGAGWGVMAVGGLVFAILSITLGNAEMRITGRKILSQHFYTRGRNVGAGLTASLVIAQCTGVGTLLQSANVGWKYGLSGPLWFAVSGSVQIFVFAILAIRIKIRAPRSHTYLEVIKLRWGTISHAVFMVFALAAGLDPQGEC